MRFYKILYKTILLINLLVVIWFLYIITVHTGKIYKENKAYHEWDKEITQELYNI